MESDKNNSPTYEDLVEYDRLLGNEDCKNPENRLQFDQLKCDDYEPQVRWSRYYGNDFQNHEDIHMGDYMQKLSSKNLSGKVFLINQNSFVLFHFMKWVS